MAHKTLIGGTSYDISGGKTLVNGTSYSIAGGKTLVGGTDYDISFGVDLAELFRGMTVLHVEGRNGSSKQGIQFYAGDYVGIGNTGYVFSFCGGDCSIFKVVVGQTITPIYQSDTSYAGLSMSYSGIIAYYHGVDTTPPGSSSYNTSSVYGATLALVQFDQPEAKVDAVLSAFKCLDKAGYNGPSPQQLYISNSDGHLSDKYYFVAASNNFTINKLSADGTVTNFAGNYTSHPSLSWYDTSIQAIQYSLSGTSYNVIRGTMHFINEV